MLLLAKDASDEFKDELHNSPKNTPKSLYGTSNNRESNKMIKDESDL